MAVPAIQIKNLSKEYLIGARRNESFRERIGTLFSPTSRRADATDKTEGTLWALNDVSFDVSRGEVVGVIGANGAGKSTLLKVLSRITEPTSGRVEIQGRVGSLLEVGSGFHPELTGRENIYLQGAILGMGRSEIDRKFDDIIDFARISKFLDTPIKRYSSGMYVRLGFAVAAHFEPDVLLVDEVLSVGDAAFQKKCLAKMDDVAREGRTVLYVSHSMGSVHSLCSRTVWLDHGQVAADGPTDRVVSAYLDRVLLRENDGDENDIVSADPDDLIRVEKVVLRDAAGQPVNRFPFGADITVEVHFDAPGRVERPAFWIGIGERGSVIAAMGHLDGIGPDAVDGPGVIRCRFFGVRLLPRVYNVDMGVLDANGATRAFSTRTVAHLEVLGTAAELGLAGDSADAYLRTCAPFLVPYEWELPDGRRERVEP